MKAIVQRGYAMHHLLPCLSAAILIGNITFAYAAEIGATLKDQGCRTCHHDTKAGIGPSFSSMAGRRCADADTALKHFSAKLREGPGHPRGAMNDDQLAQLANWICSLRRD